MDLISFGAGVLVTLIIEIIVLAIVLKYDEKLDKRGEK